MGSHDHGPKDGAKHKPEQTMNAMYKNKVTGTTVAVVQTGKTFKTVTVFPATKRVGQETIEKKHYAWSGVEKWLKKLDAELLEGV